MTDQTSPAAAVEEGGPNYRFKNAADGSLQITVEEDYEGVVKQLADLVGEGSTLWLHIGDVLEKLAPDLGPFDRREATAEILRPVRQVFIDAFW